METHALRDLNQKERRIVRLYAAWHDVASVAMAMRMTWGQVYFCLVDLGVYRHNARTRELLGKKKAAKVEAMRALTEKTYIMLMPYNRAHWVREMRTRFVSHGGR